MASEKTEIAQNWAFLCLQFTLFPLAPFSPSLFTTRATRRFKRKDFPCFGLRVKRMMVYQLKKGKQTILLQKKTEQISCILSYFAQFYELKEMADWNDGLHAAANCKRIQFWSLYTDQVPSVGKAFTKHTITTKPHKNEIIQVSFEMGKEKGPPLWNTFQQGQLCATSDKDYKGQTTQKSETNRWHQSPFFKLNRNEQI